jgi:excisionase family DNA binding protein
MTDGGYRPPDGYLTMAEALTRLGISKATLQKRVRAGELPTYRDPRNKRVRLVKVEDVDRLAQPVPEPRPARG